MRLSHSCELSHFPTFSIVDKPAPKAALVARKVPGKPFVKGDPRINRAMPGPGRPPDEFKALCQALACSALEAANRALADENHPAYLGALKWATEHGYGKPKESVELTGANGGPIQLWTIGETKVSF